MPGRSGRRSHRRAPLLLGEQRRAALEHSDDAGAGRTESVHSLARASGVKPSGPLVSPLQTSV